MKVTLCVSFHVSSYKEHYFFSPKNVPPVQACTLLSGTLKAYSDIGRGWRNLLEYSTSAGKQARGVQRYKFVTICHAIFRKASQNIPPICVSLLSWMFIQITGRIPRGIFHYPHAFPTLPTVGNNAYKYKQARFQPATRVYIVYQVQSSGGYGYVDILYIYFSIII